MAVTESENPFDQIDPNRTAVGGGSEQNPFDAIGPNLGQQSSATGAFARGAERSALPAIGSIPAISAGAELGAGIGAMGGPLAPVTVPAGTIIGGFAGALLGSTAISKAQDWALSKLPDSWREAIGMDDRQERIDQGEHPIASFLGGLAPYALTMRPGAVPKTALPENATALQKIMAHPATARVFGGAAMGGMEAGQEAADHQDLDWRKVAISTGFGMVFNRPTKLGEAISEVGARPARALLGHPSPTIAQAGDAKVAGPGITESVFQGTQEQEPSATMTAQDAARTEKSVLGEQPDHDLHAIARRMEPDLFTRYDDLASQRDQFRQWINEYNNPPPEAFKELEDQRTALQQQLDAHVAARGGYASGPEARQLRAQIRSLDAEHNALTQRAQAFAEGKAEETPDLAQARQHLMATDFQLRDLAPQVSAAYRRAADAVGAGMVEAVPHVAPEPETTPVAAPESQQGAVPEQPIPAAPSPESISAPSQDVPGAQATKPLADQKAAIAADVTRQLIAAGRPAEEAEAAGQVVAARYATRAAQFKGALGTAEELYRKEGAEIKGPRGAAPAAKTPEPTISPEGTMTPEALREFVKSGGKVEGAKEFAQAKAETDTPEFKQWFGQSKVTDKNGEPLVVYHGTRESFEQFEASRGGAATGAESGKHGFFFSDRPKTAEYYSGKGHPGVEQTAQSLRRLAETYKRTADDYRRIGDTERAEEWDRRAAETPREPRVIHTYLSLQNPLVHDFKGKVYREQTYNDLLAKAKAEGRDGVILKNTYDAGERGKIDAIISGRFKPENVYVAFDPTQIKSATENVGTFDPNNPNIYHQAARGKITFRPGRAPLMTLMKDANASTFLHESGHQWLEELLRDAQHESAPPELRDDADTVLSWLGAHSAEDIKTKHHEKFARGFEQYMREGVAPSPELAGVFAKFKQWLVQIYQTIKGLGKPINDDIRGVFDRMLATEPQRTVIAPERPAGPTLADIHEADATHTEPHEAEPAADRIRAETERFISEPPPEIADEIAPVLEKIEAERAAGTEPGGEAGAGEGERGQVGASGGEPGAQPAGRGVGETSGPVVPVRSEAEAKGAGLRDAGHPLAPGPATLFGPDESPFIDKAGNIRIDNLTTNEDVARAIRDAAEANDDFIGDRRGVITDGQVMELADALGMDFQRLNTRKLGQAFNAEQIIAARKLLIQSATTVSEAMKKAATGTDEDVMAYAQAKDRHQMIQAQVSGITAEAGRALRAFRNIAGQEAAQNVDQFIKGATGKTLFQLRREAQLGLALDTPQQVSKFMNDARERSFGRMLLEYWVNGLISGPATHTTYMIGNALLALNKAGPETAAAALLGRLRQGMGREGNVVHLGEVKAQLAAGAKSIPAALEAAGSAFKTGVTTLLPGEKPRALPFQPGTELVQPGVLNETATYHSIMADAFGLIRGLRDGVISGGAMLKAGGVEGAPLIGARYSQLGAIPDVEIRGMNVLPVGTAARLPGRFIAAIHSFFRAVNYSMAKNGMAYRAAANEGLEGNALAARIGELRENPTPEIMNGAVHEATELTLMGNGGEFMRRLGALTNVSVKLPVLGETQILKFIDPFVHIAGNIINQSIIERTPIGILSAEIRADLMGKNGNVAQDMATARMMVGTGMAVVFGSLAAEGYASGSGPSDPRQAAMWRLAGNQAHSVRIGDVWYDIHRLGPLGMLLGIAADMYDVGHLAATGEYAEAAAHLQHALVQNILDESFVRGPSELIRAVEDSDRYGGQYVRNFLSSFVPYSVGMAQVARASDPYTRQARTIVDAMKAKVPGLSETLLPRRDIWGEPMPNRETLGLPGMSAIWESHVSQDPVNQAMVNLGISPAQVPRKIRNVELTDDQYDDFARISGRMTKQRLDAIVRSPDWNTWPPHIQRNVIEETIRQSREAARGVLMGKYPQIMRDATSARLEKLTED